MILESSRKNMPEDSAVCNTSYLEEKSDFDFNKSNHVSSFCGVSNYLYISFKML